MKEEVKFVFLKLSKEQVRERLQKRTGNDDAVMTVVTMMMMMAWYRPLHESSIAGQPVCDVRRAIYR